jgi:hypothetical protein
MRKWYGGGLFALASLMLAGCAEQRAGLSPADAAARVRTGAPMLTCRESCVAEWRRVQPQAAQLDAAGRWPELAALVIGTGYQDDLSLYYLGRAAEGLGFPGAGASYYRQSTYVSPSTIGCRYLSGLCGGLAFPNAANMRIAAIDREFDHGRPRRAGRAPSGAAPAGPGPSPPELGSPLAPEPPPGPPPATVAAPPAPTLVDPPPAILFDPPPANAFAPPPGAVLAPPPPAAPAIPPPQAAAPAPTRPGSIPTEYIEPPAAR